jgi:WD40 repeat protein
LTFTTAGGAVGFGTPVPSPVATISAENAVSLTQVALWKLSEGSLAFTCLAVAPNGGTMAGGANDGTVHLWRATDGGGGRVLNGHAQTVSSLAFAADGATLISGADDTTVRLWSVTDGTLVHTFEGHTAEVTGVAFAPSGQSIASGSLDGTTRVWNVSNGSLRYQVKGKAAGLAYSPDGQLLAIAGEDKIKLVRADTGAVSLSLNSKSANWERPAFSPDGKTLASSSAQVPAQLWRTSDGGRVRTFAAASPKTTTARASDNVTFSPDGQLLASGTVDGRILVWQVRDGVLKASLETGGSEVLQVVFAPDDKTLFSLSLDGAVRVWAVP